MNLIMVFGTFVWCGLCVSVCKFTVSNALLMSSASVNVCSGCLVEVCCYGVVYVVLVVVFEAMLC